ncbi:hypothetical protein DFJ77DRAFT_472703 [Powellomyces hirtus]|nr:hypothetical protein DFJ77DRAFT_472703 [Powellomyces hirtus]
MDSSYFQHSHGRDTTDSTDSSGSAFWRRFIPLKRSKSLSTSNKARRSRAASASGSASPSGSRSSSRTRPDPNSPLLQWGPSSSHLPSPHHPAFPAAAGPRRSQSSNAVSQLGQNAVMQDVTSINHNTPQSPLVALTSRQLADLAFSVIDRLEFEERHLSSPIVPLSVMQATCALAATHRPSTPDPNGISQHVETLDKIRGLRPDQLHRLAMDIETESERRFPDLALSVQSLQLHAGKMGTISFEAAEGNGRTFLSLSRGVVASSQNERGEPSADDNSMGGRIASTMFARSGAYGSSLPSPPASLSSATSSPQPSAQVIPSVARTMAQGLPVTPLTTRHSHLVRNKSKQNRNQSSLDPEWEMPEQGQFGSMNRRLAPAAEYHERANHNSLLSPPPSASSSLSSSPSSTPNLDHPRPPKPSPNTLSTAPAPPSTPPAPSTAPTTGSYTHEEFVAGLETLTTAQLVAAVRDVQTVISRQQKAEQIEMARKQKVMMNGGRASSPSRTTTSTVSPSPPASPSVHSATSDSNNTHCQNLLLQLPVPRVKLIWTAVAEEVRKRGLNVNVL